MCQKMFLAKTVRSNNTSKSCSLFNQFNSTSPEENVDPENVVNSRYFDIDEIKMHKQII